MIVLAAILYSAEIRTDPPGFFIDESSIAYNAHTIAQSGQDEHGVYLPLYFRAFGEYKNPTYIYLLALVDKLFGPSILGARLLSVVLGFAAAIVLGLLATRSSGDRTVGMLIAGLTMFEPWLFETSRLVYEVALFPLVLSLFLLSLYSAYTANRWSFLDGVRLASTLGLLTYTYSIGRLLAPLLAAGLVLFISRSNWLRILGIWGLYAITLFPLAVFAHSDPHALTDRFYWVSYIQPDSTVSDIAWGFVTHFIANFNPRYWLVPGFENLTEHTPAKGGVLVTLFVLSLIGLVLIIRDRLRDPWWRYVLYGLFASVIPASLTTEAFHTLRMIALPIFLIVISVPALKFLTTRSIQRPLSLRHVILIALCLTALMQIGWFQYWYHTKGKGRTYEFEAGYPAVLDAALNTGERTIYLYDREIYPSYIHAYWYTTLNGGDLSRFDRVPASPEPPLGALVIGTAYPCERCRVIAQSDHFSAFYDESER
jgi:4-amino-4-deoxy-L-arabinose transferase-like glycosyltransferase